LYKIITIIEEERAYLFCLTVHFSGGEAIVLLANLAWCEPQHHAATLLSFLLNEPYNDNFNCWMLRHPPAQLQGLPIVRPTKEDYANPLGHRGSGPWSLGLSAKSTVHKHSH
jgi:hypothetical protein